MTVLEITKLCTGCQVSAPHRHFKKCLPCLRIDRRQWAATSRAKKLALNGVRIPNAQRKCKVCLKTGVHAQDLCRLHYKTHAERKPCNVPDCTRGMHAQGFCYVHYETARRLGQIGTVQLQGKMSPQERFARYVEVAPFCHLWTGKLINGRGAFTIKDGISSAAHRVAYVFERGPIPTDEEGKTLELDHGCRVGHCVRPAHLEPVTSAENMRRNNVASGYADITQDDGWLFLLAIPAWQRGHDNFPKSVVTRSQQAA